MIKPIELINHFYDLTNNKNTTVGLSEILADDMTFSGPLIKSSGAKNYIEMVGPFLKAHKSWKILTQFENDQDVCSIYELNLAKPDGGTFCVTISDWIRTNNEKIIEQRIYYDPREFAKIFRIPQ